MDLFASHAEIRDSRFWVFRFGTPKLTVLWPSHLLADPAATGQGFLARFLISEPSSAIGTRLKRGHAEQSGAEIGAMSHRLQTILHTPMTTSTPERCCHHGNTF
jgi:hypothetical protein